MKEFCLWGAVICYVVFVMCEIALAIRARGEHG